MEVKAAVFRLQLFHDELCETTQVVRRGPSVNHALMPDALVHVRSLKPDRYRPQPVASAPVDSDEPHVGKTLVPCGLPAR